MIGIFSGCSGVLLLAEPGRSKYDVFDIVKGRQQDPVEAQYLYSAAQDWKEIEGPDAEAILETAAREYWLARAVSLLRLTIGGLEEPLEKRVLEHVEESLGSRVSSEKALDRLLIAPLADGCSPLAPAESALSYGFSAVASILDELADLQPLIRRLTDLWLGLPETVFGYFSEPREMIWATVAEKCAMKRLLRCGSGHEFKDEWNLLVFYFPTPQSRSGVSVLGEELSLRLFPHDGQEKMEAVTVPLTEEARSTSRDQPDRVMSGDEALERVEKQIAAIVQAISQGHDANAEKYLRELIQQQTSSSGGETYAVKSLCNIAQQCADMFRADFEAVCLNEALLLGPGDPWTLVQYGDHLKRVGNYDEALRVLAKAGQLGESEVARSSAADVYSRRGDYAEAIHAYEAIANFGDKPTILMAIADNLRKMGRMEDAQSAYDKLISSAQQGLPEFVSSAARAQAGRAEIAKRRGEYEDALRTYKVILDRKDVDVRARLFYKLGLCNVLKLMGKFEDAFGVLDEVIQQYPFAMQARFIRGSILGLIGRALEGLKDLPESSGTRSWQEWIRPYYRGLLLLKLERYGDARENLVEELPKAIASGEERSILRMAAALWFLSKDEIHEADGILSEIPSLYDCHTQYLSLVLKLHSATQKKDLDVMDSLRKQIAEIRIVDETLEKAVEALSRRDFPLALTYETDTLLKLAA